jgi:hypothetical protein
MGHRLEAKGKKLESLEAGMLGSKGTGSAS